MSDLVHASATAVAQHSETVSRWEDDGFRRQLRRLEIEAKVLARSNIIRQDLRGKPDDVLAIGLTLMSMQLPVSVHTINQVFVVNGKADLMGQLLIGLAARYGHDVWLEESSSERVVVKLCNGQTRRTTTITYTIEDAKRSGALDWWVENWQANNNGKRYCAEKAVLGYTEAEARAAQTADKRDWVRKGQLKANDAWHTYPADKLAWRAFRRAVRFGAPEVAAGIAGPVAPGALPVLTDDETDYVDHQDYAELSSGDTVTQPGEGAEAAGGGNDRTADAHSEAEEAPGQIFPADPVAEPTPTGEEGPRADANAVGTSAGPPPSSALWDADPDGRPFE